jgi:hypothetical protein
MLRPFSLSISTICLLLNSLHGQSDTDFRAVFGERYKQAERFVASNPWIKDSLEQHGINPDVGLAIVFPELIRYSSLRDRIETLGLETLYVQYGSEYANFSIGPFQIKPGFALRIEKDQAISGLKSMGITPIDTINSPSNRAKRVARLKDIRRQVQYLVAFIKSMENRFGTRWQNNTEKLTFLATAYNTGEMDSYQVVVARSCERHFHTELLRPPVCYCYCDVSLQYYRTKLRTR